MQLSLSQFTTHHYRLDLPSTIDLKMSKAISIKAMIGDQPTRELFDRLYVMSNRLRGQSA